MFFIRQFLKSPLTIDSVCPSDKVLSRALTRMAFEFPSLDPGLIVDLGAGTGVITRELLASGISPGSILAVDVCDKFEKVFNRCCVPVSLCVADAKRLPSIISSLYPGIAALGIISSLPLRNMGKGDVREIMRGIRRILLEKGGFLLQYTYALWDHAALTRYGFSLVSWRYVVRNMPPALIEMYNVESAVKST